MTMIFDSINGITLPDGTTQATKGYPASGVPATGGTVMISGNMPAFSAYAGSNQSISASTLTDPGMW